MKLLEKVSPGSAISFRTVRGRLCDGQIPDPMATWPLDFKTQFHRDGGSFLLVVPRCSKSCSRTSRVALRPSRGRNLPGEARKRSDGTRDAAVAGSACKCQITSTYTLKLAQNIPLPSFLMESPMGMNVGDHGRALRPWIRRMTTVTTARMRRMWTKPPMV